MRSAMRWMLIVWGAVVLPGCGYNTIQQKEEAVTAVWSAVMNQYQRRSDLIPNLVLTVQGYASHERQVLTAVTEARAQAVQVNANDPAALQQFQGVQGELTGPLSRLMAVVENYPALMSDQGFRDLQAQLEGTGNRIVTAHGRYMPWVQEYNTFVRSLPAVITAKLLAIRPNPILLSTIREGHTTVLVVQFDTAPAHDAF